MNCYCGIDLGAKRSQVCIIDDDQKVLVNRKVANDLDTIHKLIRPHGRVPTVIESTFNWYWIVDGLQIRDVPVTLAHSLKLAAISTAKVKTDKRDALTLAKLLRAKMIPESYIYPSEDRPLRDLMRQRWNMVAMRADEYRRMRGLLYRNGIFDVGSNDIRIMGEEEFNELVDHPLIRTQARYDIERVELLTKQIRSLEKDILSRVKKRKDFQDLQTIPGIGTVLALTILLEIGDIKRFAKSRQFASYCRVAPGCADSGDSHRRGRGNKQGNPYLKWALTQAAACARRSDPTFREYFAVVQRKHPGASGIIITHCIVAHRLSFAVWHVLKDGQPYNQEKLFRSNPES
jgi:transposase